MTRREFNRQYDVLMGKFRVLNNASSACVTVDQYNDLVESQKASRDEIHAQLDALRLRAKIGHQKTVCATV